MRNWVKIWSDWMNIDSLALSVDDSLLMDCSVILQPMRVHCQCICCFPLARALAWQQRQFETLKSILPSCGGKSWIVYALTSQPFGETAKESMFWIEIWKKKKSKEKNKQTKNLNTQGEFGIGIRFHIQLLSRLCHLIILQEAEAATGNHG